MASEYDFDFDFGDGGGSETNADHNEDSPQVRNPAESEDEQQEANPNLTTKTRGRGKRSTRSEREELYRQEGHLFPPLARELSLRVHGMKHNFKPNGFPPEDILFSVMLWTFYHEFSSRRFDFMLDAFAQSYLKRKPAPNTLLWHLRQKELTPVLHQLLGVTVRPLLSKDTGFAVDATRIYTYVILSEEEGRRKFKWLKLHLMCGITSLAVTAVRVTPWTAHEMNYLEPLLQDTLALGFKVEAVMADRGYVSKHNIKLICDAGAKPVVTFKRNNRKSKNGSDPEWDEVLERFRQREGVDFLPHRKRNTVETVHSMIKKRFGNAIRASNETGQYNAVLLKAICHNLTRLIRLRVSL